MRGEGRDEFLLKLAQRGLKLAIWGDRWERSALWPQIQPYWRGVALSGREYVYAISGAKICLGLLSKGNRDLHTTRSMEIPFAGGLLCAERTSEHIEIYDDGVEAIFWSNVDDCFDICSLLIDDEERREAIKKAGAKRVRDNRVGNEDLCRKILSCL
jgi:hypothetical protein